MELVTFPEDSGALVDREAYPVDEEKRAARIAPTFNVDDVLRLDALRQAQAEIGD